MAPGDLRTHDNALFNALAERGPAHRSFLRAAWFDAATPSPDRFLLTDDHNAPIAGLALTERRKGLFTLREVAGGYWPFRGVVMARDAQVAPLAEALDDHRGRLGRIWRLGPVEADDPVLETLRAAARTAGWHILSRPLGRVFELDLAALGAQGDWPSTKTQRKNRWRKRRLEEESGPLRVEFFAGTDWTPAQRDAMAQVEAASWLGKLDHGGDTKFRDPAMRGYWEALCADPRLAAMLFGSLMWLGDTPAAFTFGIQAGDVRYYIANNYDQRFTQFGPGRVLLYDDFARAAGQGVTRISWGLGDAGYKSEMGAQPGPELVDLLFVRGALLSRLLSPWWERAA
ncbi:GNAT family N-acetyltransferase [Qipengyuania sp. SS22]|uniref:GNAT family N-acetyltransferase n=1 Tax=Qipengyuania sp. SS22 TaxID=2979461 RepID=UPI0021E568C0|nr:GNAT family N-acetyltransferase [Qipengyuania sp. SS22]UYH55360.1 GNAT family N-acetyltransferase [Qipengyuania sp. SS22]